MSLVLNNRVLVFSLFCSLTMILITDDDQADNCHLNHILTLVFDAMVLLCGQDELINIKNVERFKKDIKVCLMLLTVLQIRRSNKDNLGIVFQKLCIQKYSRTSMARTPLGPCKLV